MLMGVVMSHDHTNGYGHAIGGVWSQGDLPF